VAASASAAPPSDELSTFSVGAEYGEEKEARSGYITDLLGHSPDGTPLSFQVI
jgi:hypothetical protein